MKNLIKVLEMEEPPRLDDQPKSPELSDSPGLKPQISLPKKIFTKKYIDEVYVNLVSIKTVAFQYCQKIWEMSNEKVDSILASQDFDYILMNPCTVAKTIINKTEDEALITSVHQYIVSIRNSQLFAITTENIIEIDMLLDDKCSLH